MSDANARGLDGRQREVLDTLLRGASLEDVGWALDLPPDTVAETAQAGLDLLAGAEHAELDERRRQEIGRYLLRLLSPGRANGTWEVIDGSQAAADYAEAVRTGLIELGAVGLPTLPADGGEFTYSRAGRATSTDRNDLAARREERRKRRQQAEISQAAAIEVSPFRAEAVEHQQEAENDIRLPHYASRSTRISLYALLAILLVGFVFTLVASVPTYTTGKVIVIDFKERQPSRATGPTILAIFPERVDGSIRVGQDLRVQLPDTEERVTTRIRFVSEGVRSPAEIARRFSLSDELANRVRAPSVVAVAEVRLPKGSPKKSSFIGAVTTDADVRTGRRRVISVIF